MKKLEEKVTFSAEKEVMSYCSTNLKDKRGSLSSSISFDMINEKEIDLESHNENNNQFYLIPDQFFYKTPLQSIITKFCNNQITDYIFHTKIYLEYDEENAFIFIFKNSLVFTHIFDEKSNVTENPIIYIVKFHQVRKLFKKNQINLN